MIYNLVKGKVKVNINASRIKQIVQSKAKLSELDKENIAIDAIKLKYKDYIGPIGSFVGIKKVSNVQISTGRQNYDELKLDFFAQLIFCKVNVNSVLDFKITYIHPKGVKGRFHNYIVQVPIDYLSSTTPTYNASTNSFQFSNSKIKEQDNLRIRVTSIMNPSSLNRYYKIQGSCRNTGSGLIK